MRMSALSYCQGSTRSILVETANESVVWLKPFRQSWKPFFLRAYTLASISIFCLLLIALIDYLAFLNQKNGAITSADANGAFTALQSFCYLYLSMMIAVFLSMVWNWVDLDIKRLEPFYQLSQLNGALAEHSLLLEYPIDFLPSVPIKAAKAG